MVIDESVDLCTHFLQLGFCGDLAESIHHVQTIRQLFFLVQLFPEEILPEVSFKFFILFCSSRQSRIFKPTD